ncbi:MAG TPA: cytochrome c family protein [Crenalkalicoccus sp.]|nr:cytochrome c family protein [Crenalkalicoccus sp.]
MRAPAATLSVIVIARQRQGPPLAGVPGRRAGSLERFHHSPALAQAGFTSDAARPDAWLAKPQEVVPGTTMLYRQANAEPRHQIIDRLKEQH